MLEKVLYPIIFWSRVAGIGTMCCAIEVILMCAPNAALRNRRHIMPNLSFYLANRKWASDLLANAALFFAAVVGVAGFILLCGHICSYRNRGRGSKYNYDPAYVMLGEYKSNFDFEAKQREIKLVNMFIFVGCLGCVWALARSPPCVEVHLLIDIAPWGGHLCNSDVNRIWTWSLFSLPLITNMAHATVRWSSCSDVGMDTLAVELTSFLAMVLYQCTIDAGSEEDARLLALAPLGFEIMAIVLLLCGAAYRLWIEKRTKEGIKIRMFYGLCMVLIFSASIWWFTIAARVAHLQHGYTMQALGLLIGLVVIGVLAMEMAVGIVFGMAQALPYLCWHSRVVGDNRDIRAEAKEEPRQPESIA